MPAPLRYDAATGSARQRRCAVGSGPTQSARTSGQDLLRLGQQLVAVPARRATIKDAVTQLIAGPRTAEIRRGVRNFVPKTLTLRTAARTGHTATIDLSSAFAQGGTAEARTARLAQLVFTVSSITGITSVLVRIDGRTPAPGVFPHFDLTKPLTRAEIIRPKVVLPKYPAPRLGPPSPAIRKLQQRLADLSYLPANRVDGRAGNETTFAVIAFQKWAGLPRDGVVGPATTKALATAERPLPITPGTGNRIEVLLDRQLALLIEGNRSPDGGRLDRQRIECHAAGVVQDLPQGDQVRSYPFQVASRWMPGGIAFTSTDVPPKLHPRMRSSRATTAAALPVRLAADPVKVITGSRSERALMSRPVTWSR
jgi:peptidoglycan hydrolase-like protein with peptidoglycan-binding domain